MVLSLVLKVTNITCTVISLSSFISVLLFLFVKGSVLIPYNFDSLFKEPKLEAIYKFGWTYCCYRDFLYRYMIYQKYVHPARLCRKILLLCHPNLGCFLDPTDWFMSAFIRKQKKGQIVYSGVLGDRIVT